MSLQTQISTLVTRIGTEFKGVYGKLGDLTTLGTTTKTSLVAAINEINAKPTGAIDDVNTAGTTTWSSTKISGQLATKQPGDTDLTAIAALDATVAGAIASDGAGWVKKTYTQFKTALAITKADVGLSNADNTSDANKPVSTAQQNALDLKQDLTGRGAANGYAPLDATTKIPAGYLPAYVDDVLEYANLAAFPASGTGGIIYVAVDTNLTYRWSGSAYVEISPSPGSTTNITEGTNLYYTQTRTDARINTLLDAQMGDETHDFVADFNAALV